MCLNSTSGVTDLASLYSPFVVEGASVVLAAESVSLWGTGVDSWATNVILLVDVGGFKPMEVGVSLPELRTTSLALTRALLSQPWIGVSSVVFLGCDGSLMLPGMGVSSDIPRPLSSLTSDVFPSTVSNSGCPWKSIYTVNHT